MAKKRSTKKQSGDKHVALASQYVRDVLAGIVPANKWIRAACQRHLDDLEASNSGVWGFDPEKAGRACRFVESFPHTKGRWARDSVPFVLSPWQAFFVCSVFGWVEKATGRRRFRTAFLLVPRKNGKSDVAARIGLYMMSADGEAGAEVYSGATTLEQALEVWRPASKMAEKTPAFRAKLGVEVSAKSIFKVEDGSRFQPVTGDPGDGASPSCAIVDEYHEHKNDSLVETMVTGMGAREQPLLLVVTTAGADTGGPCYAQQLEAQKVLDRVDHDDRLFALIYGIDAEDDWTDEASLIKANPNYGISIEPEYLANRLRDAKANARKQSAFKTKHLNVWVGARSAYFDVSKWEQAAQPGMVEADYHGRVVHLGLDLAAKRDLAGLEILIPLEDGRRYARFGRYYLPEATVNDPANDRYRAWADAGLITVTDGNIIDYARIREDILGDGVTPGLMSLFEVRTISYDPWHATQLATEMMAEGAPMVEVRNTVQNLSDPMKTMEALISGGDIIHNGDPVFTWMVSNVVALEDAKSNVFPRKERSENKIDGVVAHLMALGRALGDEGSADGPSVYEASGIMFV